MRQRSSTRSTGLRAISAAVVAVTGFTLASCSAPTDTHGSEKAAEAITSDPNAELVVWTDATRQPGFEEFQKTHPNIKMKIVLYDGATLLAKMELFNRTGSGWPDVIFPSSSDLLANLAGPQLNYAQPLDSLIPSDVQKGFGNASNICKINGKLYCLPNDLAQTVLWYNKPLMDAFGYALPTTWDQYEQLGARVAKEHPGYVLGFAGDQTSYYNYFEGSGCPLQDVTGQTTVHIDTSDARCTRVARMLDTMIANRSVSKAMLGSPELRQLGHTQEFLTMPGPSWFGDNTFKRPAAFNMPNGKIAAAPIPKWAGEPTNYSGAFGGGTFMISRHSKNMKGAAEIIQWMTTDIAYQKTAVTYPAYEPAAEAWGERMKTDPFYAADPFPVLKDASSKINPIVKPTTYDVVAAFTQIVKPAVQSGKTIASVLPQLQTELVNLAKAAGYAVK